ncbi:MAG: TonB-dependent receptor [Rikenellaceae bacterium]
MKKIKDVLLVVMMLLVASVAHAVTLKGKVVDSETKEPLLGATLFVLGTNQGTTTDLDGAFELKVGRGVTNLEISYISYVTQILEIDVDGKTPDLLIELVTDSQSISEVVVSTRKNLENEAALQNERIASNVAIENMGAKEMSIKGISNVEEGVKKITGISIEDSGQVLVRGLGDRYSLTTMNGLPVASPNPDNKLIPLDLFPSSIVQNITVSKVYMVSAFADYSGALIDIATKDVVNEDFFNISVGASGTIGTLGNRFYQSDRGSLWSTPTVDPNVVAIDKTLEFREYMQSNNPFETTFSAHETTAIPDFNFGLSGGKVFQLFGRDLSALVSLNVENGSEAEYDSYLKTLNNKGEIYKITTDRDSYTSSLNTTALASLNYAISDNSRIGYTMFYSRSAEDKYYTYWCNNDNETQPIVRGANSVMHIYSLLNNQISGDHSLSEKLDLNWSASYATTFSGEPDRRQTLFTQDGDQWLAYTTDSKNTIRYFSEINESEYIANINLRYYLGDKENNNSIRLGFNSRNKSRDFSAVLFAYGFNFNETNNGVTSSITPTFSSIYDPDGVLNYENIQNGNFVVEKKSDPSYTYWAKTAIYAGYFDLDYNIGDLLVNVGLRYEDSVQGVDYTGDLGAGYEEIAKPDIFPAANLKWTMNDEHSLRLALSKSVTRPSFVEMAPFRYKESGSSGTSVGNEHLQNGYNYNIDARYEFFKDNSTDMISLTGYYKYLDTPIERIQRDAGGDVEYSYQNSESGLAAGVEFEIRKSIAQGLNLGFNASYIYTNVQLEEGNGIYTDTNRQLQGASPYLVNADVSYLHRMGDYSTMSFSLVYNLQGPRIEAVGVESLCDVMQEQFNTLNFVYNYQVNSKLSVKAKVDNILCQSVKYTQYVEMLDETITVGEDNTYMGASIGLTYNF